ncbi:MAG: phage minor capsid protein, partial [Ruthenibacterium sp.]
MLTPDYLEHAADTVVALYASLEDFIVRDIARRLMKAGAVTHGAAAQILRAQESGALYDDIIKRVSALMGESEANLRALFLDAGLQSTDADNRIYTAAGLSPAPLTLSFSAMRTLQAGLSKTGGLLFNLTKTTANAAQEAYIRAATMAEMQIESGAFDYARAIRNAVRGLVDEAAYVQYPTGHRSRIDVAVRRAVLTGVNQTTAEISLQSAREMGCALVEVSAHVGARASHALWQGRVFCLSGTRDGYENFYSATGYGTGAGLCGWNCRHDFYPYFEGLSESAYPKSRLEEYKNKTAVWNGREMPYYDATQRQRAMERRIRDTRRSLAG